ncbi:MAG: hypothetical protein JWN69_1183 [Alphaproteobacteria bacterium]|nr:hypothetical protein [Alphaproteobacteria bacterium]
MIRSSVKDLGFFRRANALQAGRSAAGLDYELLIAALRALQSASLTARVEARTALGNGQQALVELLLAGPRWRDAIAQQRGSFNLSAAHTASSVDFRIGD